MTGRITPERFGELPGVEDWACVARAAFTFYPTASLAASAELVTAISAAGGEGHAAPEIDIRPDGVTIRLLTVGAEFTGLTEDDVDFARRVSAAAHELGLTAKPSAAQNLIITIDALNIPDVLPFWRAVLSYEPRVDAPDQEIVDPGRRTAGVYFQQMDAPRTGRNRIHIDVWVPFREAEARVEAALKAGGKLVTDRYAPGWWVLADAEGNEACVATWVATA
ncbi:VOC family protein [Micromonospora sp. NPDC126480]|uniref:VOC family protein n=1 Tax=Micromonospora sp. NPDC126480 TaxID=3155312 RepID=UPI0033346A99